MNEENSDSPDLVDSADSMGPMEPAGPSYEKEKLGRIADKSLNLSLMFYNLNDLAPATYNMPTRMGGARPLRLGRNYHSPPSSFDTSVTSFARYAQIEGILKDYGIKEAYENFRMAIEERAFERNERPDYRSYWEAMRSAVYIIQNYAEFFKDIIQSESDLPPGVLFELLEQSHYNLETELNQFYYEWTKLTGGMGSTKESIEKFLVEIYGEDAEFVQVVLNTINSKNPNI